MMPQNTYQDHRSTGGRNLTLEQKKIVEAFNSEIYIQHNLDVSTGRFWCSHSAG